MPLSARVALAAAGVLAAPLLARPEARPATPLEPLFLAQTELPSGWEIVNERSEDPRQDPDLVALGVSELLARHYTRARGPRAEVCSIEIWSFAAADQARSALPLLQQEGWKLRVAGHLLISLRGTALVRGRGFEPGLFPDCIELGDRIGARAARAVGAAER